MTELNTAPEGGAEVIAPVVVSTPAPAPINVSEAARSLSAWRAQKNKQAEPAETPEPPQELAVTPTSDPPQEAPAETTDAPEPAEVPPIEPPRSWTKEEKEEFATYPREAQEKIARREQDRETSLRRSQNEAADAKKAIEAERAKVEQARQQYESALPALLQHLQETQLGEFGDVKSIADLKALAVNDPFRFAQYQAKQMEVAAVQREVEETQKRQAAEYDSKWSDFTKKEDQLLIDKAPELADKTRAKEISEKAVDYLKDIGFSEQDLAKAYNGKEGVSLRDHRLQLLILDGVKYREAKAAPAKKVPATVPPVLRPGVAPAPGAAHAAKVEQAREQLSTARGNKAIDAAAKLYAAQKAARR